MQHAVLRTDNIVAKCRKCSVFCLQACHAATAFRSCEALRARIRRRRASRRSLLDFTHALKTRSEFLIAALRLACESTIARRLSLASALCESPTKCFHEENAMAADSQQSFPRTRFKIPRHR